MGDQLAAMLNGEIDNAVTEDNPREDIVSGMATSAGISEGTVNQILNGTIECPPLDRLEGMASALSVSMDAVISAAEGDGCDYERGICSVPSQPRGAYQRKLSLERGSIGTDGAFPMTLATQGEAVDGHILRVRGIDLGESLPLQVDHNPSARANVGIIDGFSVIGGRGTPDALRAKGRIRTSGSGEGLDLRRDLIDAIDVGDITGVSLRWQGIEVVERTALPKSHAAHVKRSEADPRLRYGLFFEKSRALEGSIVGIGSDRAAMIGRSESAASETLATFWHSMAGESDSIPERMVEIVDELEGELSTLRERLLEFERQQESDTPSAVDDDSAEIKSGLRMDLVTEVIGEAFARMEAQNIEQFRALEKDLKHGQIRRHPQR